MSGVGQEAWPALPATQPSPPRPAPVGPPHSHRAATQVGELREQAGGDVILTREALTRIWVTARRAPTLAHVGQHAHEGKPRLGDG